MQRPAVLYSQRSHESRLSAPQIYPYAAPPYQQTLYNQKHENHDILAATFLLTEIKLGSKDRKQELTPTP